MICQSKIEMIVSKIIELLYSCESEEEIAKQIKNILEKEIK